MNDEPAERHATIAGTVVAEWDDVRVTGTLDTGHRVADMPGTVGTVDDRDRRLKVWPDDADWPGLPDDHDGKLWFGWEDVEAVVVVRRETE